MAPGRGRRQGRVRRRARASARARGCSAAPAGGGGARGRAAAGGPRRWPPPPLPGRGPPGPRPEVPWPGPLRCLRNGSPAAAHASVRRPRRSSGTPAPRQHPRTPLHAGSPPSLPCAPGTYSSRPLTCPVWPQRVPYPARPRPHLLLLTRVPLRRARPSPAACPPSPRAANPHACSPLRLAPALPACSAPAAPRRPTSNARTHTLWHDPGPRI